MKYYQACYGKPHENWEFLYLSRDIAPALAKSFERIVTNCMPRGYGSEVLLPLPLERCLYGVLPLENHCLSLRVQYGGVDSFGRPKMFAHGIFLESDDKDSADIRTALSVSDADFRLCAETVGTIPQEPTLLPIPTPEAAFAAAGLSVQTVEDILSGIFIALDKRENTALYLVCGEKKTDFYAVLQLLSALLPSGLRGRLLLTNSNLLQDFAPCGLVLAKKAPQSEMYVNLETGESNIPTDYVGKNAERFQLYEYICALLEGEKLGQVTAFLDDFQHTCDNMGLGADAGFEELAVAFVFRTQMHKLSQYTPGEATTLLYTVLLDAPVGNIFVDNRIAEILSAYRKHDLLPKDQMYRRLEVRVSQTASADLKRAFSELRGEMLLRKCNGSCAHLTELYRTNPQHAKLCFGDLGARQEDQSNQLLKETYLTLLESTDSPEAVGALFRDAVQSTNPHVVNEIRKEFVQKQVYYFRVKLSGMQLQDAFFAEKLQKLEDSSICRRQDPEFHKKTFKWLIGDYWENLSFSAAAFTPTFFQNAECIADESFPKYKAVKKVRELFDFIDRCARNDFGVLPMEVAARTRQFLFEEIPDAAERKELAEKIQDSVRERLLHHSWADWKFWKEISLLSEDGEENCIARLWRWQVPVFADSQAFIAAYQSDESVRQDGSRIVRLLESVTAKSDVAANAETVKNGRQIVAFLQGEMKRENDGGKQVPKGADGQNDADTDGTLREREGEVEGESAKPKKNVFAAIKNVFRK